MVTNYSFETVHAHFACKRPTLVTSGSPSWTKRRTSAFICAIQHAKYGSLCLRVSLRQRTCSMARFFISCMARRAGFAVFSAPACKNDGKNSRCASSEASPVRSSTEPAGSVRSEPGHGKRDGSELEPLEGSEWKHTD